MSVTTNLPALDNTITISAQQIDAFRKDGHTLIKNVLSKEEMAVYRNILVSAAQKFNTEKRKMEDRDTYGKAFLQIMNLWRNDEGAKKFVMAKRFAKIAADLLGVENVRLYHDQALFKEPGGGPTPWHQDQYYWPVDTNNTITMWMPLVDISVEMGMLTFASGSQKNGAVFEHEISDESEDAFDKYVHQQGFPVTRATTMQAGDATWHYGFTIHNAPGNKSSTMREVMTIIYIADGATVTTPKNKWQEADRQTWFLGRKPGELAASEINPLML
jgi:ectoine hydroxylase-related dioxygenase (phytanoyl-CoA dioxygenase family)